MEDLARRFPGKPLRQPQYNFRDVPFCARDLTGSTLGVVTERQHLVDSIAELTLLCSEATRRKKPVDASSSSSSAPPPAKKTTKPLSIEYIFDRIDTDDPLWGLMVRTDTPMSFKGRTSNLKSSPNWKRGMLQGFILMTTFTNWQSSFRFDSQHEMAFGQDEDELEEQMKNGLRKYDEDGSLAEELESCVKGGNPHQEGIVYPRIAEVSLFGGLGCGKQLLRLLVEHLERLKATARQNYDFIVLQATDNSIPFYEAMGFTRVGCVQGKDASPDKYHSSAAREYHTKKNGETPLSIAKEFGVEVMDILFFNNPIYEGLVQKSWLKKGTKIFIPEKAKAVASAPKWYKAPENETPRGIAKKFGVNFSELLKANRKRYPDLMGQSRLMEGTRIQVSRFDHDEGVDDTVAYSHWTFPDADQEDNDMSYMMALKLDRKKGSEAKVKPVADSLAVSMQAYCPKANGAKNLLIPTKLPQASAPLASIFTKKPKEPKKPKGPTLSYGHFMSDARSSMVDELKGMSFGDVNKVLSEKWKAMSDEEKAPYQKRYEESKAAYNEAMKKYEVEMERYKRESTHTAIDTGKVDSSLLEKVVKLKSTDGISGASKSEYYYVLTFIPDLQWVHLIPMKKVGSFGPEYPDAIGRPIWMIVDEEEGKEFDTTAAMCQPVIALTMKNSADADSEMWTIYDDGEKPPPPRPAPMLNPQTPTDVQDAPKKPKKPATSFAFFCGAAKYFLKEQLENKPLGEHTKIIAEKWKVMTDEEKKKYRDQQSDAHEKYAKALKQYKEDLAKFHSENPGIAASSAALSKTPKSSKKIAVPSSAILSKTPKSASSAPSSQTPKPTKKTSQPLSNTPMTNDVSQKKKRGRPRKHSLPNPDTDHATPTPERGQTTNSPIPIPSASGTPSIPKRGRPRKSQAPTSEASGGTPTRKQGKPRKNPVANSEASEETPILKRKRGRPCKSPLSETVPAVEISITKAMVHTVKNNPLELEKLLGKLAGDRSPAMVGDTNSDQSGKRDIVLSLISKDYKVVMWQHFNILGKTRDNQRENEICDEVFQLLKQRKGNKGRFLKGSSNDYFEVDEADAREKIISDIRRRLASSQNWFKGEENDDLPARTNPPPEPHKESKCHEPGDDDVVLSLFNDRYKNIMWRHFRKLGPTQKGGAGEQETGRKIFQSMKNGIGNGGRFFKKLLRSNEVVAVNDDVALQKIMKDLKRRMDSSHNWLVDDSDNDSLPVEDRPQLSPTGKKRRSCHQQTSTVTVEAKPLLSPSRYPRRGAHAEPCLPEALDKRQKPRESTDSPLKSQSGEEDAHISSEPAEGLPEGWRTRRIPRKNPRDSRVDTRWYSPELNLKFRSIHDAKQFAERVEALGKGEGAVTLQSVSSSPSKKATAKTQKPVATRALAPIFLKSYGKKRKLSVTLQDTRADSAESDETPTKKRYPARKRKLITEDDSHVVSDDAVSELSFDVAGPRKKRVKTTS